jgi:hypothetical membrane protein
MTTLTDQKKAQQNMAEAERSSLGIKLLTATYILVLPGMFILPFFNSPGYSIIGNTLSELGAQSAPHAWIMNFMFISLAFGSVIAGWRYFEGFIFHRIVLVLFGVSLTLMAFFNHAPIRPDIQYSITEEGWHAYFSCSAGLSFVILSIATGFILDKQQDRLIALAAGTAVLLLSVLMSEAEWSAGIWQRLMFILSFGWMIYNFKTGELHIIQ